MNEKIATQSDSRSTGSAPGSGESVALFFFDADKRIVTATPSALALVGYSRADLQGISYDTLIAIDEDIATTTPPPAGAEGAARISGLRHKDGGLLSVEASISQVRLADQDLLVCAVIGIATPRADRKTHIFSENLVEEVQAVAGIGFWEWDFRSDHVKWSSGAYQILGLDRSNENAGDEAYLDMIHPDDRDRAQAFVQAAARGSGDVSTEFRITQRDGSTRYVAAKGQQMQDATGQSVRLLGVVQDITAQKLAEDAARQSELRFRTAIEASLDAFYVLDSVRNDAGQIVDFRIAEINENAALQMSMPRSALIGTLICEMFPVNRTNGFFDRCVDVVECGKAQVKTYQVPQGQAAPGWYQQQVVPVDDGVCIVNRDITDQKLIEIQLKVAVEQLQLAINTAEMGIWRFDTATERMEVNDQLLAIYGIPREQIRHDMAGYLDQVSPEDRSRVQAALGAMLTGKRVREIEFQIVRPDQSRRHVSVSAQPIVGAEQNIIEIVGITVDITAAKEREIALREREAFLRAIFDSALNGLLVCDDDARCLSVNQAAAELLGLAQADLVGMDLRQLPTPQANGIEARIAHYVAQGKSVGEFEIQRPDGQRRTAHYQAVRVGEDFNLVIIADVTEQKRADQALRASEARYRTLFESANDFVFLHGLDEDGKPDHFLEVNQHACQRLGYSLAEFRKLKPIDLLAAEERATAPEGNEQFAVRRELIFERRLVGRDNVSVPVELHARLFEHQGRQLVLSIGRDVSERIAAAAALRRLNQAIEQSPVSVVITDAAGRIEYVNPKFCETTEYSVDEVLGRNPRVLKSGEHPVAFYQEMWATIAAGQEWRGEILNRKKGGALFWELASIAGVRDDEGTVTHYIAVKEEITHRKQLEEERVRQERLASVGHLAAGIAHDFNNILASIVLYTRLALQSGSLSPENRDRITVVDKQAWHASKLVSQILDFSRRGILEKRSVELVPLVTEQVNLLQRTLPENIYIEFRHDAGAFTIHADPTRIQQIITNLAVNARDAMPDGGRLTITLAQVRAPAAHHAALVVRPAEHWVRLTVSDTGSGIAGQSLPFLFEPFFTTKGPGEGSGLGLAQVHGIVGQHGGQIGIDTVENEGTTFSIYLPALGDVSAAQAAAGSGSMQQGDSELVLVVEDEPALREALTLSLTELRYQVASAADGAAALQLMAERGSEIALVISDMVMPVMGGKALVSALRERGWLQPILLITGHAGGDDLDAPLEAELIGVLSKPFSMDELAAAVHKALRAPG